MVSLFFFFLLIKSAAIKAIGNWLKNKLGDIYTTLLVIYDKEKKEKKDKIK